VFLTAPAKQQDTKPAQIGRARVFPVMIVLMLIIIMLQVRSFPAMAMVFLTAPLGLAGAVPILLAFGQPARPVILTALAAVLAFIPLTMSVFWGSMAYTLIGGTAAGTVLTLVFLPALYAIWFKIQPSEANRVANRALTGLRLSA
jgi:multidrug efflux pump subunit AcrB